MRTSGGHRLTRRSSMVVGVSAAIAVAATVVTTTFASAATGPTFTVNTTSDTKDANLSDGICADSTGACSLRAAVQQADKSNDLNEIDVPAGAYTLTIPGPTNGETCNTCVGAASTGDLDLLNPVSIVGRGSSVSTITTNAGSGAGSFNDRVFDIPYGGFGTAYPVSISGLTITHGAAGPDENGSGGGLFDGMDTVDGSSAGLCSPTGAATCTLQLSDVALEQNTSGNGGGGAAFVNAQVAMDSSKLENNSATNEGGGIDDLGQLTLTNTTIDGNSVSNGYGGGIHTVAAGLHMTNVSVKSNGVTNGFGGGIYDSDSLDATGNAGVDTISGSLIEGNNADLGGGGLVTDGLGDVSVDTTTFESNTASGDGGAGAENTPSGTLSITSSTFTLNDTQGGYGGAIFDSGPLSVANVTMSLNFADRGAGLYSNTSTSVAGTIALTNDTIAANAGTSTYPGGIYAEPSTKPVRVKNTIVSHDSPSNCTTGLTSLGHNISDDATCGFTATGDQQSTDPELNDLNTNGGAVQTMAIPYGSPAVDHGTNTGCPSTDARGVARPVDGDLNGTATCDVGAYEMTPADISTAITATPTSVAYGGSITYHVTASNLGPNNAPRRDGHTAVGGRRDRRLLLEQLQRIRSGHGLL